MRYLGDDPSVTRNLPESDWLFVGLNVVMLIMSGKRPLSPWIGKGALVPPLWFPLSQASNQACEACISASDKQEDTPNRGRSMIYQGQGAPDIYCRTRDPLDVNI